MSAPPDELPGRTRPPVRTARLVLALLVVVAAAVALLPDLLGLDHRSPFAQLVSFRPPMLAGLIVIAVVASVVAVVRKRGGTLAGGLLAVVVIAGAMVLPRALATAPEPQVGTRTLTVLTFNTHEGDGRCDDHQQRQHEPGGTDRGTRAQLVGRGAHRCPVCPTLTEPPLRRRRRRVPRRREPCASWCA